MKKIYDLDSKLDIASLENLHFKICMGIAKSKTNPSTRIMPHYEMSGDFKAAVDYKNNEQIARIAAIADDATAVLTPDELTEYNLLSYTQKRNVLELYKNGYRDGDFVRIRFTKDEFLRDKFATFYSDKTDWTENTQHFPELMAWIQQLPFIDIGRILIFVTRQYIHSDLHYDRRDVWANGMHHFIWFNPFNKKKFFLVDGYEKEFVNTRAAFFDTSYLHGNEPIPETAYSIRVDGQLSEEFCRENDIEWVKRP